jgi:hypothetical protein
MRSQRGEPAVRQSEGTARTWRNLQRVAAGLPDRRVSSALRPARTKFLPLCDAHSGHPARVNIIVA